ncbi:HEPN domain-containing protein [Candidatus Poribacteria bacterium]|nr:HEPN domain-containing protein [Candidatus Poribacteria bacterium]
MLNKAREHLKSAEILFREEQYRDAVSRAYYAAFSAMLAYVGQPPKGKWEHPGLRGVFIRKLGEAGMPVENCRTLRSNLLDLHDARIDADYSTTEIGKRVAIDALEIACNVISLVERGG